MSSDRMATELKPNEIRAAIPEALRQEGGRVSTLWLPEKVAAVTGTTYPVYDAYDSRVNNMATRMADAGLIVRVKHGDLLPDGKTTQGRGWFYTRERYAADLLKGQEAQEARRQDAQRREAVRDRLAVLGLSPDGQDRLSLGDWEALLAMAERGLRCSEEGTTP